MKKYKTGLVLLVIALALLGYFSPWFFLHIAAWQKDFNQFISENLHQIQNNIAVVILGFLRRNFSGVKNI